MSDLGPIRPQDASPALGALLEHERAGAELLATAERDARAMIDAATERADARRARLADEAVLATRALDIEHQETQRREIEAKQAELGAAIRRIESIDDPTVAALVEHVLRIVISQEDLP